MRGIVAVAITLLAALGAHPQLVSPNLERGFDPQKAYAVEEIGVVNLFNGNLNVTIPIGIDYPVSSTLSYGLALQYGGNNWEYDTIDELQLDDEGNPICALTDGGSCEWVWETRGWGYPTPYDNAGFGWRMHFGRILPKATIGHYAYESPDGSVHSFYPTLHDTPSEGNDPADTFYTRDGSYLRLKVTGNTITIESPDGTIRKFNTTSDHPSEGGVEEIRDRFGNWVKIDYGYSDHATDRVWHIEDSVDRHHYVHLKPTATYHEEFPPTPVTRWSVAEIRSRMSGTDTVWELHYTGEEGASPQWSTLKWPCMDVPNAQTVGSSVQTAMLEKIVPPAGGVYTFTYDMDGTDTGSCRDSVGALKSVTLPTLGKVEWKYMLNAYPPNPTSVTNHKNQPSLYKSVAVQHRKVRTASGIVTAYREYATLSDPSTTTQPALEHKVTVTDYTDDSQYKKILGKSESFFTLCNTHSCVSRGEYALPFTRKDLEGRVETDDEGRHLSTITYGPGEGWTQPLQRTYVKYDADIPLDTAARGIVDYNRRLQSQRTVHYTESSSEWIDKDFRNFDGLGHYRVTEVSASFGGTSRKTHQNFNPAAGEFTIGGGTFAMPSSWILNRFDFTEITDTGSAGTSKARTDYCFADTGFLERKRIRRFASEPKRDLLVVYSGWEGNVIREEHYGGDASQLPAGVTCTSILGTELKKYTVNHSYDHGVRKTSAYEGAGFPSMDLDIDPSGLVTGSRDPAGRQTTFKYDALGRLEEIRPPDVAWTHYEYSPAVDASTPAKVVARQWPYAALPGDTPLTETRYYYDHLGRLMQQRTSMDGIADHKWSAVKTRYDALGRTAGTSVAIGSDSGDYADFSASETTPVYDALGRVTATVQPDGKHATVAYTGASTVKRTVNVATSSGEETAVSTRETLDGLGRLVSVIENDRVVNSVQQGIETTYRYDAGDRLTNVSAGVQTRTFQYDDAGLLTSESHPEIDGKTEYWYDSGSHVVKKQTPLSTLLMSYDAAERLTNVSVENGPTLQVFTYDTTSRGKMATAARHNHHAELGEIVVTETFRYTGPGGRLSSKETAIRTATPNGWPTGQTFSESYTYDPLGQLDQLTYPSCSGCGSLAAPQRTVDHESERGYLKSVMGYTKPMKYHPNGLLFTLQRQNAGGGDGPLYEQLPSYGMARPGQTSLSGDCTNLTITEQPEPKTVAPGQPVNLSVGASGATKYEWFEQGGTTPVGTSATLATSITTPTVFFARASNGTCSVDSAPVQVSLCTPPNAAIATKATINPNGVETASVEAAASATYAWSVENGTLESGQGTPNITFKALCTGIVKVRVTVTANNCPATSSRDISVVAPSVSVSATPSSVVAGASTSLTATLSGAGPWSLTWSDDPLVTAASRSVIPRSTTTYSVTKVNGCAAAWGSVTVEVTPPPVPTRLNATRTAAGVQLTWSVPAGADVDKYTIYRCEMSCVGTTGSPLPEEAATTQYLDPQVGADRAYVYRVSARKLDTASAPSAIDFASGVFFTDDPIVAGVTQARAVQLAQMRAAVDGLRLAAGLPMGVYTGTPQWGLSMRALHVIELRDALNEARQRLGYPAVIFTDAPPAAGSKILATYFNQIMGGVQ